MDRCDLCDLPLDSCVHGNPPPQAKYDPKALYRTGPTIAAQHGGTECPGCGDRIVVGEDITLTDDGWAHASEVSEPPSPRGTDASIFEGF